MTVSELAEKTGWKFLGDEEAGARKIAGGFVGDLLSWVLGKGEPGNAWITVQFHANVVAVAVLKEFSCLILAQDAQAGAEGAQKAQDEHLGILMTSLPAYDAAIRLHELGI